MMAISIDLVKELRTRTLAPLWDCKEALVEADWDIDLAQEILKKKWAIKADKKSGRETTNGVVKFVDNNGTIVGVKLLCETDFVARNEEFTSLVDSLLEAIAAYQGDVDPDHVSGDLLDRLNDLVKDKAVTIGEAMNIDYVYKTTKKAYVYNHGGSLSAVVFYEWNDEIAAKALALQVAAMDPRFVSIDQVPQERMNELRSEFESDESLANKPEAIRNQIIEGKIHKAVQEDILFEQVAITDQTKKIKDLLPSWFVVHSFLRVSI